MTFHKVGAENRYYKAQKVPKVGSESVKIWNIYNIIKAEMIIKRININLKLKAICINIIQVISNKMKK